MYSFGDNSEERHVWLWRVKRADPKAPRNLADYKKITVADGDIRLGLMDFCPVHGVSVLNYHGGERCCAHKKKLKHIAAAREAAKRTTEEREARYDYVRAHGKHAQAPPKHPLATANRL